ncbi:MAG: hypothetical protein KAS71_17610, partial [Bacteroidales bacterium]|nr:hypothetical protein [Bacteroidales bacterium]
KIIIKGSQKNGITEMEMQIELEWIIPKEPEEKTFALQVYIDDSDKKRETEKNRLTWFNNNYSSEISLTYFPVKLCQNKEFFPESTSRVKIIDDEKLILKTFGMSQSDTLKIFKFSLNGSSKLIEKITFDETSESFDLSEFVLDYENDEIYVFQNSQCVAYHNLILAPREYINIVPPKFQDEIRRFKASDKVAFPDPNSTLFIGSSSIRRWSNLERDFPELSIIQRGFGGSNSADVLRYINDIVIPYNVSKIIYYEGDNDIPQGMEIDSITKNIKTFVEIVQRENLETEIYLISPKPAIVRLKHYDKYKELHSKLQEVADMMEKVIFVDVASPMFLADGSLDESLFIEDRLHMNDKGYRIWTDVLRDIMELDE